MLYLYCSRLKYSSITTRITTILTNTILENIITLIRDNYNTNYNTTISNIQRAQYMQQLCIIYNALIQLGSSYSTTATNLNTFITANTINNVSNNITDLMFSIKDTIYSNDTDITIKANNMQELLLLYIRLLPITSYSTPISNINSIITGTVEQSIPINTLITYIKGEYTTTSIQQDKETYKTYLQQFQKSCADIANYRVSPYLSIASDLSTFLT